ncbi:MAG TPA: hypothetical protein VME63_07810, partial [Dyella sp.]|uniref:hypothetical protein n=1 Tax=Dyella sp. TaxID=1869338 RepID=UPI002C58D9C8
AARAMQITPVKVSGDPLNYLIKDPSNTRTSQPLYVQNAEGGLKQTSKQGTYDGKGGVKLDDGLKGGVRRPWEKSTTRHPWAGGEPGASGSEASTSRSAQIRRVQALKDQMHRQVEEKLAKKNEAQAELHSAEAKVSASSDAVSGAEMYRELMRGEMQDAERKVDTVKRHGSSSEVAAAEQRFYTCTEAFIQSHRAWWNAKFEHAKVAFSLGTARAKSQGADREYREACQEEQALAQQLTNLQGG